MTTTLDPTFADRVLRLIGGAANVVRLTHCLVRLRFVLLDDTVADDDALERLPEVAIVVRQSGQLQLALNVPVSLAYAAVRQRLGEGTPPGTGH
ncbi:PTS transporter subunit EIIB [Streptomyces sp. SAI-229]|uniref:PTS transporter subunit EIIB n=1 Tax=Streptomyces sp. SAI-229 TaxID=3377731 RepID=UPI003C7C1D0B